VVAVKQSPNPGISAVKMLGVASLLGIVVGGLASFQHSNELDAARDLTVSTAVDQAMPMGAADKQRMMDADPRSLEGIPPYPNTALPRRMFSGDTRSNGVGAVSWFETKDSLDAVLDFYQAAFIKERHTPVVARSDRRGFAAWFEYARDADDRRIFGEGTLHMVTVSNEDSRRMVFLSATEPMRILEQQQAALPGGVRLPVGATPHVIRTGETGQERATVFAEYKTTTAELAADVEKLAVSDGWQVTERTTMEGGALSMTMKRGNFVQLAVVEAKVGGGAQVLTSVEEH
jgi:hypothetical protein